MDLKFKYYDSGSWYSAVLPIISHRGLTEPDEIQRVRRVHIHLDQSRTESCRGFHKVISFTFKPKLTAQQRRFLASFVQAESKGIYYATLFSYLVNEDDLLVSEWLDAIEFQRRFTARFIDPTVYTKWSDVGAVADELMYFKCNVSITGTRANPEGFTTNSGKLPTMENGEAWPTFNGDTQVFQVTTQKRQERDIFIVKESVEEIDGNLQFLAGLDDFGMDFDSAGANYVDFMVKVMEKVE